MEVYRSGAGLSLLRLLSIPMQCERKLMSVLLRRPY